MCIRTLSSLAIAVLGLLGNASASALESGFYIGVVGGQASVDLNKNEFDIYERDPFATNFSSSLDDSDTSIGIVLGGQFGRWFAVEAQLINLGESRYQATQTIPNVFASAPRDLDIRTEVTTEAVVAALSGILTVPIGEQFAVGVRLGFAANASETTFEYEERRGNIVRDFDSFDNDGDASDVGATYGISFEWAPITHLGVRLDYQVIKKVGGEDDDYDFDEDDDDFFDDDDYYDDVPEQDGRDVDLLSLSIVYRF